MISPDESLDVTLWMKFYYVKSNFPGSVVDEETRDLVAILQPSFFMLSNRLAHLFFGAGSAHLVLLSASFSNHGDREAD